MSESKDWGNSKEFDELFEKYYVTLCFFANKYINDMDQARSLVQGLFVDMWVKRDDLKVNDSLKSYLYKATKNRAIDFIRKQNAKPESSSYELPECHVPFHDLVEEAELNEKINDAINSLPEKCKEVFILSRYEEMKYTEIAQMLQISVKTVEMQMGIALKKIRVKLSDYQVITFFLNWRRKKK
ncbi:RNA polymerase sigma-70 factor [Prolixibacteraceae bacterium JC049]|nr:RNA polymerase sigma-70 factor [Prolixibacteraceae bacterium JC049]